MNFKMIASYSLLPHLMQKSRMKLEEFYYGKDGLKSQFTAKRRFAFRFSTYV